MLVVCFTFTLCCHSYGPILSDLTVTVVCVHMIEILQLLLYLQTASKENHYFTAKQDDPYSFTTMKMSGVRVKVCIRLVSV